MTATQSVSAEEAGTQALLPLVQAASSRIRSEEVSLVDRLFALECAARAGKSGQTMVATLQSSLQDAEWQVEDDWEPDVNHAAVLGQLISTRDALSESFSKKWESQLREASDVLVARTGKFGIASDPELLAALLRGMAVANLPLPVELVRMAEHLMNLRASPAILAELSEAMVRSRQTRAGAEELFKAAFHPYSSTTCDEQIARWWLVARWEQLTGSTPAMAPASVEDARIGAIACVNFDSLHSSAMALETAGAAVGKLVLTSPREIARERTDKYIHAATLNYAFVAAAVLLAAWIGLAHLTQLIIDLTPWRPGTISYQTLFSTIYVAVFLIGGLVPYLCVRAAFRLRGRWDTGTLDFTASIAIPGVAALAGAIVSLVIS